MSNVVTLHAHQHNKLIKAIDAAFPKNHEELAALRELAAAYFGGIEVDESGDDEEDEEPTLRWEKSK